MDNHDRPENNFQDKESERRSVHMKTSSSSLRFTDSPCLTADFRPNHKECSGRRKIQVSSSQTETEGPREERLFFKNGIEDYYPSCLGSEHIKRLDSILAFTPPNNELAGIETNVQSAFQMSPEQTVNTITLTEKNDGEIVSILIRRPKVSSLLYFRKIEISEEEESQRQTVAAEQSHS